MDKVEEEEKLETELDDVEDDHTYIFIFIKWNVHVLAQIFFLQSDWHFAGQHKSSIYTSYNLLTVLSVFYVQHE